MTAAEIVRTRLLAQSALTALVSTRVWNLHLPQQPTLPAVIVQRIGEAEFMHLRGKTEIFRTRVQIDSVAISLADAYVVDAAAWGDGAGSGLSGYRGDVSTARIEAVMPDSVGERFESAELNIYIVSRNVFVWATT